MSTYVCMYVLLSQLKTLLWLRFRVSLPPSDCVSYLTVPKRRRVAFYGRWNVSVPLRKFRGKCFTFYSEVLEGIKLNCWTIGSRLVCPQVIVFGDFTNSVMHLGLRDVGGWEVGFSRVAARLLHSQELCSDKVSFFPCRNEP